MLLRRRSLVPRHRPELRPRRQRVRPRLERHRRVPRPRRRPPHLGPDLQGHLRGARPRPPSATCRSWTSASSSRCTGTRTSGSSGRRGACWPSERPGASRWIEAKAGPPQPLRPGPRPRRGSCALSGRCSCIGGADAPFLRGLLDHEHESVRAWAIRLLTDDLPIDTIFSQRIGPDVDLPADLLAKLADMASDDPSGLVRLVLASTLQRLPVDRARRAGPGPRSRMPRTPPTTTCRP